MKIRFPEELNRALVDRFAAFCFAPTQLNRRTLLAEGVLKERIFVTGNTGIDALLMIRDRVRKKGAGTWNQLWRAARSRPCMTVRGNWCSSRRIGAKVLERRCGRCSPLFEISRANIQIGNSFIPVHLNPNVRAPAKEILARLPNVHLIEPLPYEPFVFLMDRASLILTDSGGIQEEAPSLGKPVVVMRERTERLEAVSGHSNARG